MDDNEQTRLAETGAAGARPETATASSGWLSTSGSISHGRFEPGAVVDGRYRIIGLLGRGGMGEVYRADDLRLGQPVAIKLLPESLASDPQRLVQFHNEVRTARQVSHPNVCRVYDIGDMVRTSGSAATHQLYLTMEYVDGEDLASLLKRIGRLPEDKALDLARQICAGLGAAHAKGIIHRDLKPANVMLDGEGQARLMDFGLASLGTTTDVRSGTPAYMAPEQLSGTAVTPLSDIYALGLVLYELFTGRRAFQARTLGELVELQQSGTIAPPSTLVSGLAPAVERVILRCLSVDPTARPASAMAVAAALPGGDPLAAALAAGETPSPQMVAAAGDQAAPMSSRRGAVWLVASLVALVATLLLADSLLLYSMIPFDRAPATLFDRARDIDALAGVTSAQDRASGFVPRTATIGWLRRRAEAPLEVELGRGAPAALVFWYRSSPRWLVPRDAKVDVDDPPLVAGQSIVVLDLEGRLLTFERLPASFRQAEPGIAEAPINWRPFFDAAGIDPARLAPAAPIYNPNAHTAVRQAWIGEWPALPGVELRVEAGGQFGQVAYFRTFGPWNFDEAAGSDPGLPWFVSTAAMLIGPALLIVSVVVVRSNLRAGRGDRIGARRIALASFMAMMASWMLAAHHVLDLGAEQSRISQAAANALLAAGVMWFLYIAAEPYVRRTWPHILITWERLLAGRVRDPLVGRDLLVGCAAGLLMTVLTYGFHLAPVLLEQPRFFPHFPEFVLGTRDLGARLFAVANNAIGNAMLGVLGLTLLRTGLQRVWAPLGRTGVAFSIAAVLFTPLAARGQFQSGNPAIDLTFGLILVVIILGVLFRYGLFAGMVGFFAHFWTSGGAASLDTSKPYFDTGLVALGLVAVLAVVGFVWRAGRADD
ncbi:MAG: hypothetical protein AMXMBFR57_25770 [Acidimicrobiia bacterium]